MYFSNFHSFSSFFQQHTGERKQMAKAIAAVNKSSKTTTFKKRTSTPSTPAPPPKRRSFQPTTVTCYNCQQPGHIAPRCPQRPQASSSSSTTSKPTPKKWGAWLLFCYFLNKILIWFSSKNFSIFASQPLSAIYFLSSISSLWVIEPFALASFSSLFLYF